MKEEWFEDPTKAALRESCVQAIEHAGYILVEDPITFSIPEEFNLKGGVIGDVQALTTDGKRHIFFLRPDASVPVPQWIVRSAHAVLQLEDVNLYIVVTQVTKTIQRTCSAAGAGLIVVDQNGRFKRIMEPSIEAITKLAKAFEKEHERLRRLLDEKVKLHEGLTSARYASTVVEVSGMPAPQRDMYFGFVEVESEKRMNWSADMSRLLDEAAAKGDLDALIPIRAAIRRGVPE